MLKKLLNKTNLIIVTIAMFIAMFMIPNVVFAENVLLSDYLKETVAAWYVFIKYLCIAAMLILLIVTGIRAATSVSSEDKSNFKKLILYWIIGIILLSFLEEIIYGIIDIEQDIVNGLKGIGTSLAGDSTAEQQISLYESARTKAYEISFMSGTLGLIMYMILVYYTFKFFFIYIKRYANVMILILVSPITVVLHTYRKIFKGKGGVIGRWLKEFLYNVFIQVVHATAYSILVGYTLSLSDNVLSFLGVILTFVTFLFMAQIDGIIRKIFNFIGGSSTIEVRDFASIAKHPIDSFIEAKEYAKQLPQDIKNKATGIVEKFTPENVLTNTTRFANNFALEAKETMEALDGKRVKVSSQAIKKEQEKINHPNAIQKVYNTIQGLALGATSAAITGVENTAKKAKEKLKEIDESTKEARKELKQDAEMVKRFAKILKYHTKRKIIESKVEEEEENQPPEEILQATVINVLDTPEEEVMALRVAIQKSYNDMAAIVYETQGPAVFIYPELGSGYMGLSVLASAKYEQKSTATLSETKKVIAFPRKQLQKTMESQQIGKVVDIKTVRKKYKLKRYNIASVETITNSLNRRYILNNEYLSNLYSVGEMVVNGDVRVSGRYSPSSSVQFRKTSIKYKAKATSNRESKVIANIVFGRNSVSEIREKKIEEQKGKAQVQEGKMQIQQGKAQISEGEMQIQQSKAQIQEGKMQIQQSKAQIQEGKMQIQQGKAQISEGEMQIQQGKAQIPEGKMQIQQGESENQEDKTLSQASKIIHFKTAYERKIQAQETVQNYHARVQDSKWAVFETASAEVRELHEDRVQKSVQTISQKAPSEIVLQQLTDMGEAVKINSEVYAVFSDNPVEQTIKEIQGESKEDTIQIITDAAIIDSAINFDIPLEQINFKDDIEVQEAVLDNLITKGIIPSTIKFAENIEEKEEIVENIEERKEKILNDKNENYVRTVMKKTAAKFFVDAVDTEDELLNKIRESKLINNEYSKVLGEIAKTAVEVEAEKVKQNLLDQVQSAVDIAREHVETGKEVYSISKNDFVRKGEQVKEDVEEFVIKVEEAVEETAKSAVDAAIDPLRIVPKRYRKDKDSDDNDDTENREIFIFQIDGAVAVKGKYSLKLSTIKAITGKNPSSIDDLKFTVWDALKVAGGPTEDADLSAISYYDIVKNGGYVLIPRRATGSEEESLEKCKPFVDEIIKDYLVENNISNVETLRKLVHKKTVALRVKEKVNNLKITNNQIEGLIEKRIKELKFIRDELNVATKNIRVIDTSDIEIEESEHIQEYRSRQENGARNEEELWIDNALKELRSANENDTVSEEDDDSENQNDNLIELLSQLEDKKEKVTIVEKNVENNRSVKRLDFDNQGKLNARERFMRNPDQMMNKIIGRI